MRTKPYEQLEEEEKYRQEKVQKEIAERRYQKWKKALRGNLVERNIIK